MKADNLLDAIGLLDDRHFECDKKQTATVTYSAPSKRGFYILIAAIIMSLALGVAAMAASPEFRELVFSFFHQHLRLFEYSSFISFSRFIQRYFILDPMVNGLVP